MEPVIPRLLLTTIRVAKNTVMEMITSGFRNPYDRQRYYVLADQLFHRTMYDVK